MTSVFILKNLFSLLLRKNRDKKMKTCVCDFIVKFICYFKLFMGFLKTYLPIVAHMHGRIQPFES